MEYDQTKLKIELYKKLKDFDWSYKDKNPAAMTAKDVLHKFKEGQIWNLMKSFPNRVDAARVYHSECPKNNYNQQYLEDKLGIQLYGNKWMYHAS
jgi:hypothetical protein